MRSKISFTKLFMIDIALLLMPVLGVNLLEDLADVDGVGSPSVALLCFLSPGANLLSPCWRPFSLPFCWLASVA